MWISGRRAFRPDSGYYRNVRRKSLKRSRAQRASAATAMAAIIVAAVCIGIYLLVHH
jgi:hypothetical protein